MNEPVLKANTNLSRVHTHRRSVAVLLVGLTVFGGGTVAWAAGLHVWKSNEKLTANDLNTNFASLQSSIPIITNWESYVPAVADANNGNPEAITAVGVRRRVGDSFEVQLKVTNPLGSMSGAAMAVSLPDDLFADSKKMAMSSVGFAVWHHQGSPNVMCNVFVGSALKSVLFECPAATLAPGSLTTADEVDARFTVPIVGLTATGP